MKQLGLAAIAGVALVSGPALQAAEYASLDPISANGMEVATAPDSVSYGTHQYRTQYEISDILNAVTEDIANQLSAFLGSQLDDQGPQQSAGSQVDESTVVSAY